MKRTKRFNRPLALIMADLDLLRNINNTYGHLAGDTVLAGIARLIQQSLREYDMAGRFGGEEFILALPETDRASAYALAERLRKAIEKERFTVSTSPTPIGVTMSMGIACYPDDAIDMKTLVHEADVAVYHAKLSGRNCVVNVTEVPRSIRLESRVTGDRFAAPSVPTFNPRPEQVAPAMPEASTAPAQPSAPDSAPLPSVDHPARMGPVLSIHYPQYALPAFVGGVSVLGIVTMLISLLLLPLPTTGMLQTIAVLTVLAVGVELLQIKNYFDNTISVSVSILFAAAIITGIPGLAIVSAAIALIHHLQKRPRIYKTVFNWANHLIAGSAAALVISVIGLPLQINHLPVLAVPLIGTAFMYFGLETGLLSTAIGLSTHTNPIQIWREQFKWLTSHYLVLCILGAVTGVAHTIIDIPGILVFMLPILMMHFNQKEYLNHTEHSMQELKRLNYELSYANKEVLTAKQTIEHINEGLFVAFAKIIDARDPFVSGHADKVADYSAAIARELGLPPDRVEIIRQAGFMHDIGKIAIAEHVLHKPSKLTDEEYEYIKTHAALGGEFLETCHGLRHLAPFVRHHHEWWNGHGYPDGLCGEQIPLESRILAVCDSVEAMASDRPYHKGWPVAQVIEEVRRCAGTQFDPTVAEAFIHLAEQHGEAFIINSADKVREKYGDNIFIKNNIIPFPAPSPEQGYSTLVPAVEK